MKAGLGFSLGTLLVALVSTANAQLFEYDASSNSLPEQQGWEKQGDANTALVFNNRLSVGPTTNVQFEYWTRPNAMIDFDSPGGVQVDFSLEVLDSDYLTLSSGNGPVWRAGWHLTLGAMDGRLLRLGISDSGVIMSKGTNNELAESTAFLPFDTQRTVAYRIVIQNGLGALYADGIPILEIALTCSNLGGTAVATSFGDVTQYAGGEILLDWLQVDSGVEVPAPQILAHVPMLANNAVVTGAPVEQLQVIFSEAVTFDPSAVEVRNGDNALISGTISGSGTQILSIDLGANAIVDDTYTVTVADSIYATSSGQQLQSEHVFQVSQVSSSADLDSDGDVDIADFTMFQAEFTGPVP
jgi:hypothetical protein